MDMLKQLDDAVAYIEQNLCGEICPGEAARIACITEDSFLRFFSYMTGMTLAEYVRCRRLTLAAYDLQQSRARVMDIAVKYGYAGADAFFRAFVRQHHVTPTQARKHIGTLKVYPPVSFRITIQGAKEMDFRMIDLDETVVYGISKEFDPEVYPTREALRSSMWSVEYDDVPGQICAGRWNEPENHAYDGVWYGIWRDGQYTIAREEAHTQNNRLEQHAIPAGQYAAFTTARGGLAWEELPKLFEQIFGSWLESSGYALRNDDIIEVYHLWTDHNLRKRGRYYEVWIPVEAK